MMRPRALNIIMRPILSLARIAFMLRAVFTAFVSQEIRHSRNPPLMPSNLTQLTHGPGRRKCGEGEVFGIRIFILGARRCLICDDDAHFASGVLTGALQERDTQKQWQAELQPSGFFN